MNKILSSCSNFDFIEFKFLCLFRAQKYFIGHEIYFSTFWFSWYSHVVSTLANVIKIGVENDNILLTLSNIKAEIHNIDSILFNVVNLSVDVYIIISTLIWRYPTLRPYINLATMLNCLLGSWQ